jgi:hypothetical protein
MSSFSATDDFRHATFTEVSFRNARFVRSSLAGVVMRGVNIDDADIDAPWLLEGGSLIINGVDVVPFVDAELDRRFPGRADRRAVDPPALREAWAAVEAAWAAAVERAAAMPDGTVDRSLDGEWSFSQTIRHLVMAIDTWFGGAVLGVAQPYHPVGQPNVEYATDGYDMAVFSNTSPSFADVLAARADRQAMVRDFLASATDADLAVERRNPWAPDEPVSSRGCIHTVLEEEWEHLRYALRDLDVIASRDE